MYRVCQGVMDVAALFVNRQPICTTIVALMSAYNLRVQISNLFEGFADG